MIDCQISPASSVRGEPRAGAADDLAPATAADETVDEGATTGILLAELVAAHGAPVMGTVVLLHGTVVPMPPVVAAQGAAVPIPPGCGGGDI